MQVFPAGPGGFCSVWPLKLNTPPIFTKCLLPPVSATDSHGLPSPWRLKACDFYFIYFFTETLTDVRLRLSEDKEQLRSFYFYLVSVSMMRFLLLILRINGNILFILQIFVCFGFEEVRCGFAGSDEPPPGPIWDLSCRLWKLRHFPPSETRPPRRMKDTEEDL